MEGNAILWLLLIAGGLVWLFLVLRPSEQPHPHPRHYGGVRDIYDELERNRVAAAERAERGES